MAAATAALIVGASVMNATNSYYGAKAQAESIRAEGAYQKSIYDMNASGLEVEAADAIERGKTDAKNLKRKVKTLIGTQRASYAGQGVDVNSGSAIRMQDESYTLGQMDGITIQNNAWRESWGYKVKASQMRYSGRFAELAAESKARTTLATGKTQAFTSLLQGGAQFFPAGK